MANNKHLIIDDRITISQMLRERKSFKEIGESLNKDPSTISKEIRNHIILSKTGCHGHAYNNCIHRYTCDEACLCDECINRRLINRCRFCKQCNDHCDQYEPDSCLKLKKPPYVCNGCPDAHHKCTLEKHMYVAKEAQLSYEDTLHTCRTGINFSEDEVKHLDDVISPLLRKGHSIHNVCAHHKDEVMISESSVYRLVDYGLLSAKNIDLPRKVRFAPRKKRKNFKVDRSCRIGRTYEDYQLFMQEHPEYHVVEMDSVEGKKGGKVLLTIHFVRAEFMLAYIRNANDSQSVIDVFERLYLELLPDTFIRLFPVILGDNGSEFSNPSAIETDMQGNPRTRVFYCNPQAPYQKGAAERNHEFIRLFIPKGKPLDPYSQDDISLMMDHINSYSRKELGDKSPYDMMSFMYGEELLKKLGCNRIPNDEVTLNKSIFEKED